MDVLLSIKPKFAESIINGRKKYEFRKNAFSKKNIGLVYIYSTTPIKKIVGIFRISKIIEDKPSTLWHQLKDEAGISEEEFFDYFKNREVGFAFEIVKVEKFETPVDPKNVLPNFVPPQSFCYLKSSFKPDDYERSKNKRIYADR
ncbi:ASCH domain-containing protein [Methanothrix soehngenii]|uniref:ASCH domain-containing protein n=1 Tax=Methanothrix soehngenii TaxID=2223 RepID=UPI00300D6C66